MQGHCNCRAITVTIPDSHAQSGTVFCGCLNCRRQSGAVGTFLCVVDRNDVKIEGEPKGYLDKDTDSGTELTRWFCGDCGSPVMSTSVLFEPKVFVKMGLFPHLPAPTAECYTKERPEWMPALPGAAQFKTSPGTA